MTIWPLVSYFVVALVIVAGMIGGSYVLGERHSDRAKGQQYEGGIVSEGSARVRFSIKFYLVAMLFVIFDLESIFLFLWAVAARELGWSGYWEAIVFVGVLAATLAYLWRVGALDWAPAMGQRLLESGRWIDARPNRVSNATSSQRREISL